VRCSIINSTTSDSCHVVRRLSISPIHSGVQRHRFLMRRCHRFSVVLARAIELCYSDLEVREGCWGQLGGQQGHWPRSLYTLPVSPGASLVQSATHAASSATGGARCYNTWVRLGLYRVWLGYFKYRWTSKEFMRTAIVYCLLSWTNR